MKTRTLSYDRMQAVLGREDRVEDSTNRADLKTAAAVLRAALELELTDRQRQCVRMYFYEGMTMEAIGRELGISKPTVCRHLQRAKARLGRILSYVENIRRPSPGDF